MKVDKIYTYPVKALQAVELTSAELTKHGLKHDRRFMILHVQRKDNGTVEHKNVHVALYPESVRFFPSLDLESDLLTITHRPPAGQGEEKSLDIPLKPYVDDLETIDVEMHKSSTKAYKLHQRYSDWLSACYGFEVLLVYLGPNYRPVRMSSTHEDREERKEQNEKKNPSPVPNGDARSKAGWFNFSSLLQTTSTTTIATTPGITFADCAPYLIASTTSLQDLHSRLPSTPGQASDILKFRPNILISGAPEPWDEDYWGQITVNGDTKLDCIHNCGRCTSINIDYETGKPGEYDAEVFLKRMQKDRRVDPGMKYSPIFGRYAFLHESTREAEESVIKIGDEVVVSKRLEQRTVFDWDGLATA